MKQHECQAMFLKQRARSFGFYVAFEAWSTFATDIALVVEPPSTLQDNSYENWGGLLFSCLGDTYQSIIESTGEIKELGNMEQLINTPLASFGFKLVTRTGSAHDFEFKEIGNANPFLFGEGKESGKLPRLCTEFGHELCLFGFATRVAKTASEQTRNMLAVYFNLRRLLDLLVIINCQRGAVRRNQKDVESKQ
jgi:hypothetical protein